MYKVTMQYSWHHLAWHHLASVPVVFYYMIVHKVHEKEVQKLQRKK